MSEAEATPRPWRVICTDGPTVGIVSERRVQPEWTLRWIARWRIGDHPSNDDVVEEQREAVCADADLIVEAVNAHDRLRAEHDLLTKIVKRLSYMPMHALKHEIDGLNLHDLILQVEEARGE